MKMRATVAVAVLAVTVSLLGCSGGSSSAGNATGVDSSTVPADGGATSLPGTSQPGVGPVGDGSLQHLLLQPKSFGSGYVYQDSSSLGPKKELCTGVALEPLWRVYATMSVRSTVAADNANAQENLFAFDAGDATKFMNGFKAAIKTCSQQQGVAVRLDPVAGRGDEAFRIAPPEPGGTLPFDLIAIRLGDRVVALLSTYSPAHPVLTDSVVAEAVSKAEAG